jgi:hypothetical protein
MYQNYGNGNLKRIAEGDSGQPDGNGDFRIKMTVPLSAQPGIVTVSALLGGGWSPDAQFTVTGDSSQSPSPTLKVDRAFTTNGTTAERSTFKPGDSIWYVVAMHVKNGPAKATVKWRAAGPQEIFNYTSKQSDINSGYQAPYAPSTIPKNAPAGKYTLTASVIVDGSTTIRKSRFTVVSPGGSRDTPDLAHEVIELTRMFWQVVATLNTVCDLWECKMTPPDVAKSINTINKIVTVADLADASRQALVVRNDLEALKKETHGHVKGAPLSPKARALAKTTWNDTRELHKTLVGLVPGLEQFFPIPPPK